MLFCPKRSVEKTPPSAFRPKHCPWRQCANHKPRLRREFRYVRLGFFQRKGDGRRIQRFRCLTCGHTFSQQSFACTYYLKRPELLLPVAAGLNAGSAHRQLARSLGCAPSTVTRLSARLGRHALLFHARAMDQIPTITETVVLDHFETFAYSQNDPVGIATPVGHSSWFVFDLEPAPHRRAGRTTEFQRAKRARQDIAPPAEGQYTTSVLNVLDRLVDKIPPDGLLALNVDDHPAYPSALQRHPQGRRFQARVFPNPERGPKGAPRSDEAIHRDQALFPVDLLHLIWRHTCANHRRETIASARRTNAILERGYLMVVWRNFVKRRSEQRSRSDTPAMKLGLAQRPWTWSEVFSRRLFPERMKLPEPWMAVYQRKLVTPALKQNAAHILARAY